MPTVQDIYVEARKMSPGDRLRLASLILDDLVEKDLPTAELDWSVQDAGLVIDQALRYAAELYGDEENLLPVEDAHA